MDSLNYNQRCTQLYVIILAVAQWYRKHPQGSAAPGGFIGFMEVIIKQGVRVKTSQTY